MMRTLFLSIVALIVLLSSSTGEASPRRRARGEVHCPLVIADAMSGSFYRRNRRPEVFPFSCFRKPRAALRAGYNNARITRNQPYTGWWRLAVDSMRSTCEPQLPQNRTTAIFLQVRQNDSGVFAEICPSNTRFTGSASATVLRLSASERLSSVPDAARCENGQEEITQLIEIHGAPDAPTPRATFKRVRRCLSQRTPFTCTDEYEGRAFLETDPRWHAVSENVNELSLGCERATQNCTACHH